MPSGTPPAPSAAAYAPTVLRLHLARGGGACLSCAAVCPAPPEHLDGLCAPELATRSGCPEGSEEPAWGEGGEAVLGLRRPSPGHPPQPSTPNSLGPVPAPAPHPEGFFRAAGDGRPATTLLSRRRHRGDYYPPLAVSLGLTAGHAAVSAVTSAQPFFCPAPVGAPRRRPAVPLREPPSPTSIFFPASPRKGARKPVSTSLSPAMVGTDDAVGGPTRPSSVSRAGVGAAPVRRPTRDRSRGSVAGAEARGLIVSPWVFPVRDSLSSRGPRLIRRMVTAASGKGGYAVIVPRQTSASGVVAGASGVVVRAELNGGGRGDVGRLVGGIDSSSKASMVSIASSSAPWWSESLAAPTAHPGAKVGPPKSSRGEPQPPLGTTDGPRRLLPLDLDEPLRSSAASDGSARDRGDSRLEMDLDGLDSSVSSASDSGVVTCPPLPPPTPPPPPANGNALPVDVLCARDVASATELLPADLESLIVSLGTDNESGSLALDPAPRLPISRRQRLAADSWLSNGQSGSSTWSRSVWRRSDAHAAGDAAAIYSPASPHPHPASSSPTRVLAPPSPRRSPLPPPSSPSFDRDRSLPSSRRPPLPPRPSSRCSPRSASLTDERPQSPLPEGAEMPLPVAAQIPSLSSTARPRRHIFWGGMNSTASTVQTWSSSMSSASAMSVSSSGTEEGSDLEESGSSRRGWFLRTVGAGTTRSGLQSKRPPGLPPLW